MISTATDRDVDAVRAFNRFYTRRIGVLEDRFLESPFSLTEVRVLYELAHRDGLSASDLEGELALDAGYLSRMLKRFRAGGLIEQIPDPADRRRRTLAVTHRGRVAFAPLDARQRARIEAMLKALAPAARAKLVPAMATLEAALKGEAAAPTLRTHRNGDIGWIVQAHGELYTREYGWDERFEALVARICADFIDHFDPERERCWIAESDGERVGCVMLVKHPERADTAKLRLLLVAPGARGSGLGAELVSACIAFARERGYRRITLWTNDVLHAARRIYEATGFKLVNEGRHHSFGKDLVEQTWELDL
jgi:DNA-binding MarR family transcriptional regulator/N-acetylglutamate synthase-like GNAT family acetyltransferase